jgi:hypothetical protein
MKSHNPVNNLRFYKKHGEDDIGQKVDEKMYETSLPRVFEEKAIRVFCRTKGKEHLARKAFETWCKQARVPSPFPSLSQRSNSQQGAEYYNEFDLLQSP